MPVPAASPLPDPAPLPAGARVTGVLAALALGFALCSLVLVWLAPDLEASALPRMAISALALWLLALPLSLVALFLGRRRNLALSLAALGSWALLLIVFVPLLARNGSAGARDRAALWNLQNGLADLSASYQQTADLPAERRLAALAQVLAAQSELRNPWNRNQPALAPQVFASGPGAPAAEAMARQQARVPGQAVFALSGETEPVWVAGAVLIRARKASPEAQVVSKTLRLRP
jgi:hypothetical protein